MIRSHLFLSLSLAMSFLFNAYSNPISITQGSIDLEHMRITTFFEGTPGISAGDYSYSGYLNDNGNVSSIFNSGDYQKISSNAILVASVNSRQLRGLTSISPDISDDNYRALNYTFAQRSLNVQNLKKITIEYDWWFL